jgi:hypothetical protein
MLKFENLANVGDIIKAYDFQGTKDYYLTGKVVAKGDVIHNGMMMYRGYTVKILTSGGEGTHYVEGEEAYIPFESTFDYDGRIELVLTQEEIEMLLAYEEEETFH